MSLSSKDCIVIWLSFRCISVGIWPEFGLNFVTIPKLFIANIWMLTSFFPCCTKISLHSELYQILFLFKLEVIKIYDIELWLGEFPNLT